MASPFFFVNKKDGKLWPCQDYWYLNDWTIKNSYPLPLISEIMDKLKGTKYFTKLDVHWGYNNIWIRKGDEWKAAFKTNKGLFELTIMFFGMCNSPATFQAMMGNIFVTMIKGKLVIVYMDNILIFTGTKEELTQITRMVLEKLWGNNSFLKAKKCKFYKTKIKYLGMIIKEGRISMDPIEPGGIRDWSIPTMVKQVRSFLGFGNFYRKFISHHSNLARPLNDLTKEDKKIEWTIKCQEAFDILKQQFTKEPILLMPDQAKLFQIESDASKVATGAVLTQLKWWPTSCSIYVENVHGYWKEIWNLWQRTPWNHSSLERMETLYPGIRTHHCCIFWSQELDVLQNSSETEWQTSKMVALPLRIWHQIDTSTRIKNGSVRCTITTTQSWNRRTGRRRNDHVTRKHVYQPTGYRSTRKNIKLKRTGYRLPWKHYYKKDLQIWRTI